MKKLSKGLVCKVVCSCTFVLLVFSVVINIKLIRNSQIAQKELMRLNSNRFVEHSEYQTSPYIGFTSFYRSVEYPDDVDILFLGDSMTERAEMRYLFPDLEVVCQGIGGDTTEGLLNRLDCAEKCHPKNIVIQIGINDLFNDIDPDKIISNYQKIVARLESRFPEANIYVESVYPLTWQFVNSSKFPVTVNSIVSVNKRIQAEVASGGDSIQYIDVFTLLADDEGYLPAEASCDGIHLMGEQYLRITDLIIEEIDK